MVQRNVYAHGRNEQEFALPESPPAQISRYAVPDHLQTGAPWTDEPGWAPRLAVSPLSTPDATRLARGGRTYRPDGNQPPETFWRPIDAEKAHRYDVEFQDADGWEESKTGFGYPNASQGMNRFADNPRARPPEEPRPTTKMAPTTYTFLRPFMTGQAKMGKREFNGLHFSMADHRRDYPILGMSAPHRPGQGTRSTYRIQPKPWGEDLVDSTPKNAYEPELKPMPSVEVEYSSRSWRLG